MTNGPTSRVAPELSMRPVTETATRAAGRWVRTWRFFWEDRWPLRERIVRWRHRHTPYRDVPRWSPYLRRYARFLPQLRTASHYPVFRAQTRRADRLESRWWYRLGWSVAWLNPFAKLPTVRHVVYCVDCGAEARATKLTHRLVGPLSDHNCPGRSDGSEPLAARPGATGYDRPSRRTEAWRVRRPRTDHH